MKNQHPNPDANAGALEDWECRIMDFGERLHPLHAPGKYHRSRVA